MKSKSVDESPKKLEPRDEKGSIHQDKKHNLKGKFCTRPFEWFEINHFSEEIGNTYVCCPSWLPKTLGDVRKNTMQELWNNKEVQEIRKSIHDGSFKYCSKHHCPYISGGTLPTKEEVKKQKPHFREVIDEQRTILDFMPYDYNFCYDRSCNLACPSCRKFKIMHTSGDNYNKSMHVQDRIFKDLFSKPNNDHFKIFVTGSGDPFGSKIFREFVTTVDGKKWPNMKISLQTNGVMFTKKNWEKMEKVHDNIYIVFISFDAATKETYNKVRVLGNWEQLLENMKHITKLRKDGKIKKLYMDFVVQRLNYKEIPAFIRLAKQYDFIDNVRFSLVADWGTWKKSEYEWHAVWKDYHPKFQDFLEVLKDPILEDPIVMKGNLEEYIRLANAN